MTVAPAMFAVCRCTHTQRRHVENEGFCEAAGCSCADFESDDRDRDSPQAISEPPIPETPIDTEVIYEGLNAANPAVGGILEPAVVEHICQPVAGSGPPAIADLIRTGQASPRRRTQVLAARLEIAYRELSQAIESETAAAKAKLEEERQRAAAREEIARLERKLAEAKAKLGIKPKPAATKGAERPERHIPKGIYRCRESACGKILDTSQGRALHERRAHGDLKGPMPTRASQP
jgi:hypothetical protein